MAGQRRAVQAEQHAGVVAGGSQLLNGFLEVLGGPGPVALQESGTAADILFDAPGRIIEYGKNGKLVDLGDMFTDEFKKDVGNSGSLPPVQAARDSTMHSASTRARTLRIVFILCSSSNLIILRPRRPRALVQIVSRSGGRAPS